MEYHFAPQIFGLYSKKAQTVNGRSFYASEDYKGKYGIWWGRTAWWIGFSRMKGQLKGFAYDSTCDYCKDMGKIPWRQLNFCKNQKNIKLRKINCVIQRPIQSPVLMCSLRIQC